MQKRTESSRGWVGIGGVVLSLTVGLALLLGCSGATGRGQGEGPGHRAQNLALTPEQELSVGRQAYREVLQKYGGHIVKSGKEADEVKRVGEKIVRAAEIRPLQREINLHFQEDKMEWEFTLIQDRQANAFCLPGGKVAVFTGLFEVMANEDELAAVLGHEIGHALAHHASERIYRDQQQQLPFMSKKYDREQESEADHIGLFLMTFAGYNPQECVRLWERMAQRHQNQTPEILSDHPSDARRIAQMRMWVPEAQAGLKAYNEGRIAK
jgi:metalloendopeptidase OMA1, mitochondrial